VIAKHGGEVLKFMGDGLLAIFPLAGDADRQAACGAALAAAMEVRDAIARLSGWPTTGPRYGVALHIGDVLYGNVGAVNRLDFTCIGPAVNLAARLEELAGRPSLRRIAAPISRRLANSHSTGFASRSRSMASPTSVPDRATPRG